MPELMLTQFTDAYMRHLRWVKQEEVRAWASNDILWFYVDIITYRRSTLNSHSKPFKVLQKNVHKTSDLLYFQNLNVFEELETFWEVFKAFLKRSSKWYETFKNVLGPSLQMTFTVVDLKLHWYVP